MDIGFESSSRFDSVNRVRVTRVSHFHSVNRARITRVSRFPKAEKARARVIINLKNVRQFVKLF